MKTIFDYQFIKQWQNKLINLPWFINSELLLELPTPLKWVRDWFEVLIDDTLLWDWTVLLSISHVLVLQKSSDTLGFFTIRPWILNPFDGSSTAIIGVGLVQHPRQPLLCYKSGLTIYTIHPQLNNIAAWRQIYKCWQIKPTNAAEYSARPFVLISTWGKRIHPKC